MGCCLRQMVFALHKIPCGILIERARPSAVFAFGHESGNSSAVYGLTPYKKRSRRFPKYPCGVIVTGTNTILSLMAFLAISHTRKIGRASCV